MVAVDALSGFTVTLGGVPLTVIPDPSSQTPEDTTAYAGAYLPQESTRQAVRRDVPVYLRRFSRGAGFVERRDEDDDGGYAWLEDGIAWHGSGIIPSGRRQNKGIDLGLSLGAVTISQGVVFNGHLWCPVDNAAKMVRLPNADPSQSFVLDPVANAFGSAGNSFHAGYTPRAIAVFSTAAGVPALYVSASDGTNWRIYQYTVAGGWTATGAFTTFGIYHMATCWWEGKDGVGAERLHINTGTSVVRHCIQGTDPMDTAQYITPLTVGNQAFDITRLIGAPGHLYVLKKNGLHDVNELRAWNLTPYWEEQANAQINHAALVYDDHTYMSRGTGLDRYDLRLNGLQQRIPGECGPMAFMQDGTPIRGYVTALTHHDGWLLAAVYNPDNRTTYICRGKDRRTLGVDVPNPLVWHCAEQVIPPSGSNSFDVQYMTVVPSSGTFGAGSSMLLMFVRASNGSGTLIGTDLYYAPLPNGAGPISLQVSGGSFTYNATARYYLTAQNWDDRNAGKGVRRLDMQNRKTSSTSTLELKSRADGDPTTITNQGTWTTQGTATSDHASITPTSGATGRSIAFQVVATTPSPYTAPPIFHELSPRARVARETFDVRQMWVVLERDHELKNGAPDVRSPDDVLSAIVTLMNSPSSTTFVDERGNSHIVYVEQVLEYRRSQIDQREYKTVARLELSLVA